MIKKLLLFFCVVFCNSVSAQIPLKLDTAPLEGLSTVILPTYDNLVKLYTADAKQVYAAMKQYGYSQNETIPGSFKANNSNNYYVVISRYTISIFFTVKMPYLETMENDIKKRFPAAVHTTSNTTEFYEFTVKDINGEHFLSVSIDKGSPGNEGGSARLRVSR